MKTIGINGRGGGKTSTLGGLLIKVASKSTPLAQKLYLLSYHYQCQLVEKRLSILI